MMGTSGTGHFLARRAAAYADALVAVHRSFPGGDVFVNMARGSSGPNSSSPGGPPFRADVSDLYGVACPLELETGPAKPADANASGSPCGATPNTAIAIPRGETDTWHPCSRDAANPAPDGPGSPEHEAARARVKKRQAQNRAAQRAFRQRKERRIKDLEDRVAELERTTKETVLDNKRRRLRLRDLLVENQVLRAALAADAPASAPAPGRRCSGRAVPSLRSDPASAGGRVGWLESDADLGAGDEARGKERSARVGPARGPGDESTGCLAWSGVCRLMLAEDTIVGQLRRLESATDDRLLGHETCGSADRANSPGCC
ncbi:bZIP transcription factor, bZIP-1 [Metarhizium album ARSEF 1941]|uniref:BZIP transcription factor, bZIP-1 n=1 Tax=Metarhizium album (strain ARSEF 1941) TaxID=1081103 RepID=A0A0B2WKU3_METAS|nr:bZIP transcription factor, bZIP-1 [Metarhizium album ARSEF 1941]KHN94568.1 bZIP transcription factor, bZIP-1 [Metarhizium album ARSEF 1941]